MTRDRGQNYQAIVAAPGFCIGVRCDEDEIHALDYLEPCPQSLAEERPGGLKRYASCAPI